MIGQQAISANPTTDFQGTEQPGQSAYTARDLPPPCCPICSSLPSDLPVGPGSPPLEYLVDIDATTRENLRMWARYCDAAGFAYLVSSIWLGRGKEDVQWERLGESYWAEICYGRAGGSWDILSENDGRHVPLC